MRKSHKQKVQTRRTNRLYEEYAKLTNKTWQECRKLLAPYKGKSSFEAGYVYAPYIPVLIISTPTGKFSLYEEWKNENEQTKD